VGLTIEFLKKLDIILAIMLFLRNYFAIQSTEKAFKKIVSAMFFESLLHQYFFISIPTPS